MALYEIKKVKDNINDYLSASDVCMDYGIFNFKSPYGSNINNILKEYSQKDIEEYINGYLKSKYVDGEGFKTTVYNIIGVTNILNDLREEKDKGVILFRGYKGGVDYTPVFHYSIYSKCLSKMTFHKKYITDEYTYSICTYNAKNNKQYKFIVRDKI